MRVRFLSAQLVGLDEIHGNKGKQCRWFATHQQDEGGICTKMFQTECCQFSVPNLDWSHNIKVCEAVKCEGNDVLKDQVRFNLEFDNRTWTEGTTLKSLRGALASDVQRRCPWWCTLMLTIEVCSFDSHSVKPSPTAKYIRCSSYTTVKLWQPKLLLKPLTTYPKSPQWPVVIL